MSACTFFGHRDCPSSIRGVLSAEIERLITEKDVDTFYVGTQGNFDRMAYAALVELHKRIGQQASEKEYRLRLRNMGGADLHCDYCTFHMGKIMRIKMIDSKQNPAIIVLIET